MKNKQLPPEVRRFILTSIASVPHIEALVLVCATTTQRWTSLALAKRLYVTPASAASVLEDLRHSGMLAFDSASDTYYFETNDRTGLVEQVAALYASHLVEITLLIHSKLDRKAQQFADAFNLRKDA
jgi:hypothetical protein